MEEFEILDELCFLDEEGPGCTQLAFIGNRGLPYVRICHTKDAYMMPLFPTFNLMAKPARIYGATRTTKFIEEYSATAKLDDELKTERKRDELAPKVAKGLAAVLLKDARKVRGRWRLPNKEALLESYKNAAEEGAPFDNEEWKEHTDAEKIFWCDYRAVLEKSIPQVLYNLIRDAIADYCHSTLPDPNRYNPLLKLLKSDDLYDRFVSDAQNANSRNQLGKVIRQAKNQAKNPKATLKAMVTAMQQSGLFEQLNNGNTIETNYRAIKAH
jgi:hypothetical protein